MSAAIPMTDHEAANVLLGLRRLFQATPLLIAGRRVGKWTLLHYRAGSRNATGTARHPAWLCRCDCGKLGEVNAASLRDGTSRNCGTRWCREPRSST